MKRNLKEFVPLLRLVKEDLKKIILASLTIFLSEIFEIFTGFLSGKVVEAITNLEIKKALIFFGIYFIIEIAMDGIVLYKANFILHKEESKLTRKPSFNIYKKALNLPSVAYEKMLLGKILSRMKNDADALNFTFSRLLKVVSSLIVITYINSYIMGLEILLVVLLLFLIIKKYNPKLKKVHKQRKENQDKFTSLTNESARGIRKTKTQGIKNNLINIKPSFLKSLLKCGVFATCIVLLYYNKISLTFL